MLYIFLEIATLTELGYQVAMILSIVNIHKFYNILMIHLLHDGDLIVEEIDISDIYAFNFDDFDSIPCIFVIVFDTFINLASKSTADEMFEVEAVWSYPLFAFRFGLYFILFITLIDVYGAICTGEMQKATFFLSILHVVSKLEIEYSIIIR
jgi:hypothetical protein